MNNIKEKTFDGKVFTVKETCYYLFFMLLFFAKGIGLYDGQEVFKAFLLISLLFWVLNMILTKYTLRETCIIAVLGLITAIVYRNTGEKGILFIFLVVTGLKNVPLKRIWYVSLGTWLLSFVPAAALTSTGIIEGPFKVHVRPVVGFAIRWSLGQAHPNVGHVSYFVLTMLIVYVLGSRMKLRYLVWLFLGNCFIFIFTVSQTGFLITTLYLMVSGYLIYRKNISRFEYGMVQCVIPSCVLVSLLGPVLLKGKIFDIVNKLMNTRLYLSREFLTQEKITLFGSGMQLTSAEMTMDNSYVFAFMTYGIVMFMILITAYIMLTNKLVKEKKNAELAIIICIAIAGITEPFLFNTSFKNLSLLFAGNLLFKEGEENNRSIGLFSKWNKQYAIGNKIDVLLETVKSVWCRYKIRIAACGIGIGIVCAGAYGLYTNLPARIMVPQELCDYTDREPVFLEEELSRGYDDTQVLGYKDKYTEMLPFEGNLVKLEYIRGIFAAGVYGGGVGSLFIFGTMIISALCRYKED